MKKIRIFAMVMFSMMASAGYSQLQVGVQLGPQFPMGDFGDGYNMGIGLNFSGKYFVTEDVAFGLNLGYHHFGTDWDDISSSMMPITALVEYYLSEEPMRPYLGIDLGAYNFGLKWKIGNIEMKDSELYFGFAPKAGIAYQISDNLAVTGELKWNYVMADSYDADWLGVNIGVALSF